MSNLEPSVILSSSSDPSMLSKALALGDFGEVDRIRLPDLLAGVPYSNKIIFIDIKYACYIAQNNKFSFQALK